MANCYDLSGWHTGCIGKHFVAGDNTIYVVCPNCGIVAPVEHIAAKISPKDASIIGDPEARKVIGGQSIGIHRGKVL